MQIILSNKLWFLNKFKNISNRDSRWLTRQVYYSCHNILNGILKRKRVFLYKFIVIKMKILLNVFCWCVYIGVLNRSYDTHIYLHYTDNKPYGYYSLSWTCFVEQTHGHLWNSVWKIYVSRSISAQIWFKRCKMRYIYIYNMMWSELSHLLRYTQTIFVSSTKPILECFIYLFHIGMIEYNRNMLFRMSLKGLAL